MRGVSPNLDKRHAISSPRDECARAGVARQLAHCPGVRLGGVKVAERKVAFRAQVEKLDFAGGWEPWPGQLSGGKLDCLGVLAGPGEIGDLPERADFTRRRRGALA
ncbi:MAG TPA: hypothetical protein VF428_01185 [Casimicrobiaceae bacterium]